ncbi:MAG: DNA repair protein RadC [Lachnospiraceae bacterium]|nr:DNA repair protein RadC [Lachnospiraceae bacterium]
MKNESGFLTVRELPAAERPYEKCLQYGAGALSDSELLAVIIRTGTKGERSVDLSRRILLSCDPEARVSALSRVSLEELTQLNGVGSVKAIQIKCAAELGRRIEADDRRKPLDVFNAKSIADHYGFRMKHLDKETVMLLHADAKGRIFAEECLSVGTVNCSLVSPREIFVSALSKRSVYIYLLHNHPSGDPAPSQDDVNVTERVANAGKMLGIKLLDHIIVGSDSYVSLNETGVI